MSTFKKIPFYDLREETQEGRIPVLIGRHSEMERLSRLIGRRTNNNALIIGESGLGKTALILGWARCMNERAMYNRYAIVQLDTEHLHELDNDAGTEEHYSNVLTHVPPSIVLIDDFGREVYKNLTLVQRAYRLYKQLISRQDVHVIITMQPHEHAWLEREYPIFLQAFETITLKKQSQSEYARVLFRKMPVLNAQRKVIVSDDTLKEIVSVMERHPALGQVPRSAIHVLDESISLCVSQGKKMLAVDAVAQVVESKTGVPSARVAQSDMQSVLRLRDELTKRIIGQDTAIAKISSALQRAKLGLRNSNRPLCSFLMLGPSGVGKTETAKSVAEIMFGRVETFTRLDMSEFQQEHMVQRLIGAPPGYIGYEEGGALTNALKREPHSLILLDEIEKAHPKVFDVFLQVLDEGRLTSGQSETVDARNAIIMATSNAAVAEILDAYAKGGSADDESFVRDTVLPVLSKTFRLEFLNRFDAILIFRPLTVPGLLQVAQLEIQKMEKRFATHRVRFSMEPRALEEQILRVADSRFGARPVKRFIEETCETLVAESLLAQHK
ncbi:MAG: ATP-dependent Clp protease ATP-binding subunit [Patescibacteria group bacterium]|nr:ATP-dependent Clp protease ATP-binding subunit [Patescibacteria group bacterium]